MSCRSRLFLVVTVLSAWGAGWVAADANGNQFHPLKTKQADDTWESRAGLWACPCYGDKANEVLPLRCRTYATKESVTDGVALRIEIKKGGLGLVTYEHAPFPPDTAGMTLFVKGSEAVEMSICGRATFQVTKEWRKVDLPWERFYATREKPEVGWQFDVRLTAPAPHDMWVIVDRVGCEGPGFIDKPAIQATDGPDETINTRDLVGNATTLAPTLERLRKKQPVRIIAFGDSVTAGGQVNRGNWGLKSEELNGFLFFSHLTRLLNQRYGYDGVTSVQKGYGGWTAQQAKGVVQQDIVPIASAEDVVIIEFGANDLSWAGVSLEKWAADLKDLIKAIQTKTTQIIIASPTSIGIDRKKSTEVSRVLREMAATEKVSFVDITKWGMYRGEKFAWAYEANPCHPSLMGHIMIAEIMETLFGAPPFDWPEYVKP